MMNNDRRLLQALKQESFLAFVHLAFQILHPGKHFYANWHIETMAWHFQELAEGNIKRLATSIHPRMLKSIISSVALPAWLLGRDPTKRIICVSYSQELSKKHAADFRRVISSERYRKLFPHVDFGSGRNTAIEQETSMGGFRFATSIEGTLMGRGGDLIIVDDTAKPGEALSDVTRNRVNDWFGNELVTRLDNPHEGAIAIVMQRLHEDDLIGRVTASEDHGWTLLSIPAIATEEVEYRTGYQENDVYVRPIGEPIDERRIDLGDLEERRAGMGTAMFNAQYQQAPVPLEGNLIKREWIKRFENSDDLGRFDAVIQSWDTASEEGELNDYSVCVTIGIKRGKLHLIDVFRRKLEFPQLLQAARSQALRYNANIILVEKSASGSALFQSLRANLNASIRSITPKGDKQLRLTTVSHMVENGTALFPESASWLGEFEKELLAFPSTKYDDQVDAFTQALKWLVKRYADSLAYDENGRKARRQPKRRNMGSRRTTLGPRSEPFNIFGNGGGDLL